MAGIMMMMVAQAKLTASVWLVLVFATIVENNFFFISLNLNLNMKELHGVDLEPLHRFLSPFYISKTYFAQCSSAHLFILIEIICRT